MWNLPQECTEVSDLIRIVWTLISGVFNIWRSAATESILNFWDNELRTVYTKDAVWVLNSGIYIINKFIKFGSYVTCTLRGLLIQMQSISLRSSDMPKSKILRDFWGLQVTQQSWLLLFASCPLVFFRSPCLTFFSLAGHLVGFILVGNVLTNAFRILGLDERKGSWVVEKDFHRNFQVNVTGFFCLFHQCHLPNCAHSGYPWPLKLKTLQAVERTWIRTGGYGWLRGKWVKACYSP